MTIDREKDIAERQDDTKDLDKRQNIKWPKEKEKELRQIVPNKRDKDDKKKEEELRQIVPNKRDKYDKQKEEELNKRDKEKIQGDYSVILYLLCDRDW